MINAISLSFIDVTVTLKFAERSFKLSWQYFPPSKGEGIAYTCNELTLCMQ